MSLTVITEGVETEEKLQRLFNWGCDEIQGYFFARPMPLEQVDHWLDEQIAKPWQSSLPK